MARRRIEPTRSCLVIGEGRTEAVFLRHLRELYLVRGCGWRIDVDRVSGKGPQVIISDAVSIAIRRDDDERYLMVDGDLFSPEYVSKAKGYGLTAIVISPSFEALALQILDHPRKKNSRWHIRSDRAKSVFKEHYLKRDGTIRSEDCSRHFPKSQLQKKRQVIDELDRLIRVFERG